MSTNPPLRCPFDASGDDLHLPFVPGFKLVGGVVAAVLGVLPLAKKPFDRALLGEEEEVVDGE